MYYKVISFAKKKDVFSNCFKFHTQICQCLSIPIYDSFLISFIKKEGSPYIGLSLLF